MSASQKISVEQASDIRKLGVFAGSGVLPRMLLRACADKGIETVVVGFIGQTDQETMEGQTHFWGKIGSAGKIIKWLQGHDIEHVVMIGAVKRPRLFDSIPDWSALKFFTKVGLRSLGDSDILDIARDLLESECGFKLHGVHEFIDDILVCEGILGSVSPDEQFLQDIDVGFRASQDLGKNDIGQSVIVKNGEIIGREDERGTSVLIQERGQEGAILVKTCKPQQDKNLDLPTIGPETVELCAQQKMVGIAVHAGHSLLVEGEKVKFLADKNGLFVIGVNGDE